MTESCFDFDQWWKGSTDIERIEWMISEKIAAFVDEQHELKGVSLFEVTEISTRKKWVRATSTDGEAYFKKIYFKPISDFTKPEKWFLTEKRLNKKHNHEYRLLVGKIRENSYVLLAPIAVQPGAFQPEVMEAFEE